MIDLLKLRTFDKDLINLLLLHTGFKECKPINNYYKSLSHKGGHKINLHFRKAKVKGDLIGFSFLDIVISPHYHKNNYLHNGDDFTPLECIKSIIDILSYLGVEVWQRKSLEVVNIEFGFNLIPLSDVTKVLGGLLFYKRSEFRIKYNEIQTFKISNATKYKEVKAYAKGLQFKQYPEFNIDANTFRFEVRTKKSAKIKTLKIYDVTGLLVFDTYEDLIKELIKEWDNVLLINTDSVNEIFKGCNSSDYWSDLIDNKHRNTFTKAKKRYYNNLPNGFNMHTEIKGKIIDKAVNFLSVQTFHREPA